MRHDLRYALRAMRRSPGFTAAATLSLAIGIGGNTAIFSLLHTILLRKLPTPEPDRLVELLFKAPGQDHFNAFSSGSFEHYRANNHVFAGVIASGSSPFGVRGEGLEPETVRGLYVSDQYFPVLGARAALGRLIGPADTGAAASVAVVSYDYWRSRFHSAPDAVGHRILVDGNPVTIIGVASREFTGLEPGFQPPIWLPTAWDPLVHHPSYASSSRYWLKLAARLKPGVSIDQARAEMALLWQWTLDDEFRAHNDRTVRDWKIEVQPAASGLSQVRDRFAKPVVALMALVAILLLIALVNVAGLLLARGAGRQREMAVRAALGAGTWRLLRQALTESLLLAIAAAAIGVVLAYAGAAGLARMIATGREGIHLPVRPEPVVLLFTAAVALLSAVLLGLVPAWRASRAASAFGPRIGETRSRRIFGRGLVAAQVAFSVVLLSGAWLFVRHVTALAHVDLGFRRDHALILDLDPANSGYDRDRLLRSYQELLAKLETIPGVRSATSCAFLPMAGVGSMRPANVEGYRAQPGERRFLSQSWVAPRYFETFGIPLLIGRDFRPDDQGRPAIVNAAFARYFFAGASPVGKHITFDGDREPYEIVGMVADAKSGDLRETPLRFVYFNVFRSRPTANHFVLRTTVDPANVSADARRAARQVLPAVAISEVRTLEEQVDSSIVPERIVALLSALFGAVGSALAALGLYGLLAYTVARRIGEIGVRMALGATRAHITRMVLGEALALTVAGLVVGAPIASWVIKLAFGLVPGLTPLGPAPVIAAAVAMLALSMAAAYLPTRRATHVDPLEALRHD